MKKDYREATQDPFVMEHDTREAWLTRAADKLGGHIKGLGYTIPPIRLSCGFPSRSIRKVLGETWTSESSKDGTIEIFISPFLDSLYDAQGIWSVLAHELGHAVVGNKSKHNATFKAYCAKVGLEGPAKATWIGPDLLSRCKEYESSLGPYPHAKLSLADAKKKQSTRMLKMVCPACGLVVRLAQKWLTELAELKHKPECWLCSGVMVPDNPENKENDLDIDTEKE